MLAPKRFRGFAVVSVGLAVGLLLAACVQDDPTPQPTRTPFPDFEAGDVITTGKAVYRSVGCSACHGLDGEGSDFAPALAGHSAEQVLRQVRSPRGVMPEFSLSQVSDEQLEEIVEFIEGLKGDHGHGDPGEPTQFVQLHQLMTISALKADNVDDAAHHLRHIAEVVTGEQLEAIREAQTFVQMGDLHDAEHLIEGLLTGPASPDLDVHQLHLRLALEALTLDQEGDVEHHIAHFVEDAGPDDADVALQALAALRGGDQHAAEGLIEALLQEEHAEPHEHGHDE